jgi:hypothetical protein
MESWFPSRNAVFTTLRREKTLVDTRIYKFNENNILRRLSIMEEPIKDKRKKKLKLTKWKKNSLSQKHIPSSFGLHLASKNSPSYFNSNLAKKEYFGSKYSF